MGDKRVLGGVGTRMLFENDRVRVWEMRLQPGEESEVHRHDLDYLMIQVAGDRVAGVPEPDSGGPFARYVEGEVSPGLVIYAGPGGIETARNIGSQPFHEIIVELKD